MTQQPHGQRLAETFLSMINTHDPSLLDRFVAEDYRDHSAFVSDGREANRQFWTAFFAAIPDVSGSMEDLVISGDRVVGRFVDRGTHTGGFMGIPPSGNPVEMRTIDIWRVEAGMFVEHWDELNLMQLFQQMDALPPLDQLTGVPVPTS
jgi:predicted ester cyclase